MAIVRVVRANMCLLVVRMYANICVPGVRVTKVSLLVLRARPAFYSDQFVFEDLNSELNSTATLDAPCGTPSAHIAALRDQQ